MIDEPTKLLTGGSLAGTDATPDELSELFVGTVASGLGSFLLKGLGAIKTSGKSGLDKYNDFVKQMGNYQGKSKKQMGLLYQKNKNLNDAITTYDKFQKGFHGVSTLQ